MKIIKITTEGNQIFYVRHWFRWYIALDDGTKWYPLQLFTMMKLKPNHPQTNTKQEAEE